GAVDLLEPDDLGIWYEVQLDTSNQYKDAIRQLVDKKALGTSSGTLPGARQVEKSGRIARWPIVELSATATPADPRQIERPIAEIKSAFKSIGLEFKAETDTPEADRTSAATVAEDEAKATLQQALSLRLRLLELQEESTW